jgi:hypothetical protein
MTAGRGLGTREVFDRRGSVGKSAASKTQSSTLEAETCSRGHPLGTGDPGASAGRSILDPAGAE